MAQTNYTPISLYFSTTAAAVPTSGNLVAGELALNTLDEKLYFKNSTGTVKLLASNAATTQVYPGAGVANSTGTAWGTSYTTSGSGTVLALNNTPTLTNPTVTNYTETPFSANSSTAITLDLANGTVQIITLTGNCVYTFPTPVAGKSFTLIHLQDATGSRTVTWPATVDWPSATAPTLTATALRGDKFVFTAISGTSWLGSIAGQNYTV
jgi:hypothetical protein